MKKTLLGGIFVCVLASITYLVPAFARSQDEANQGKPTGAKTPTAPAGPTRQPFLTEISTLEPRAKGLQGADKPDTRAGKLYAADRKSVV